MKIYISVDMEGISGVAHPVQLMTGSGEYEAARRLMTAELNAAIEGALEAGAKEITVNDAHSSMRNVVFEMLNPAARLIIGNRKKLGMMEGIDSTYQGAILIGYHARASSKGSLSHTLSFRAFENVRVNNELCGETELCALVAGNYGVPILMISGDNLLAQQVKKIDSNIEYATVKNVISQLTVDCLHPNKSRELIKEKAKNAIGKIGKIKPIQIKAPYYLEVDFSSSLYADIVELMPKTKRVNINTIAYTADDHIELTGALFTMANLEFALMAEMR